MTLCCFEKYLRREKDVLCSPQDLTNHLGSSPEVQSLPHMVLEGNVLSFCEVFVLLRVSPSLLRGGSQGGYGHVGQELQLALDKLFEPQEPFRGSLGYKIIQISS